MKTFLFSQIRDFILSQPDERPVHLFEGRRGGPNDFRVGCILLHFVESLGLKPIYCGIRSGSIEYDSFELKDDLGFSEDEFQDIFCLFENGLDTFARINSPHAETTYGFLKSKLKK